MHAPRSFPRALAALLLLAGCGGKSVALGQGPEPDARLTADLYTWPCEADDGTGNVVHWEGVFSYDITLEYAPDALADRGFPESGCALAADLFPTDAGVGAVDIPGMDEPRWSNGSMDGTLPHEGPGFYYSQVFANQRSCQEADDLLGAGTLLEEAGAFTGAKTDAPGLYEGVTIAGKFDDQYGITFGSEATVSWEASEWDSSWVQVRREEGGRLVEAVTCATTGTDAFTIDESVWSMFSGALEVDVTNLYVGVENTSVTTMDDGQIIETTTRAVHVAVVED